MHPPTHNLNDTPLRQAQLKMISMLNVVEAICQKHHLDYWLEGGTLLGAIRHQGFVPWDDDLDVAMPRESYEAFRKIAPSEIPENMWLQTEKTETGYFNLCAPTRIRDNNSRYIVKREAGVEPYHQGIYIDIFPLDKRPENYILRKLSKTLSKKVLRTLYHKYAPLYLYPGHYAKTYRLMSRFVSKQILESILEKIIQQANTSNNTYLGYGYDTISSVYFKYDDIYPIKRAKFENGEFNIPNNADSILRSQFGDYWKLPPKHKRGPKHYRELIPHIAD